MTLRELLQAGEERAVAIAAPERTGLTFAGLRNQAEYTAAFLRRCGLGRNATVAIVLPNGAEMAAALLAIAAAAAAAPLNPALSPSEFEFLFRDLGACALLTMPSAAPAAVSAARACGLPLLALEPLPDRPAGSFRLAGDAGSGASARPAPAQAEDIALCLHTSGSTAAPRMVPLRHRNLCASASNMASSLQLGSGDCCLNVMPLFHVHGFVGAVLASVAAGGRVYCAPGYRPHRFFSWLKDSGATWYTAVPTMHQQILLRAKGKRNIIDARPLRLVRSCSAPLPARVWEELESVLGAPVINCYGMTEASHQIACNPLPPRVRKRGTVGVATGVQIAIRDESGRLLPPGVAGEIVIRGPAVMDGYTDARANAAAFADGWLRTGDMGTLDRDGYVTITGRLKEIINVGGEKVSPYEVDEVLMQHHAVAQAVTFPIPHPRLGENVGAAVILHNGHTSSPEELRTFVAQRLVKFKIPRKILILDALPQGPTGKLRRIGLAAILGLA